MIRNLNLPPETSQDTSTVLPSAYGPMVVEASRPDSSTITGVLGGTENKDDVLLKVVLDKNKIDSWFLLSASFYNDFQLPDS